MRFKCSWISLELSLVIREVWIWKDHLVLYDEVNVIVRVVFARLCICIDQGVGKLRGFVVVHEASTGCIPQRESRWLRRMLSVVFGVVVRRMLVVIGVVRHDAWKSILLR